MIQAALSWLSRSLSFLSLFFALVFGLLGAALLINNEVYTSNKIFLAWLLIDFQSSHQWSYPIFFWGIGSGFLLFGIVLRRRTASSRPMPFNQPETTGTTWMHSPATRILLRIGGIGAYVVLLCFLGLNAFGAQVFNAGGASYKERLSYQGHVYLLSVAPRGATISTMFIFEVSQCDDSGWFCHVIYDRSRNVSVSPYINAFVLADLIDVHLQVDTPHQQLVILYQGEGTSDAGKLLCSIPS
jgi:hypothetical protein